MEKKKKGNSIWKQNQKVQTSILQYMQFMPQTKILDFLFFIYISGCLMQPYLLVLVLWGQDIKNEVHQNPFKKECN